MIKPAYLGKEDYIFISYSHKDNDFVYPFIEELQKHYNVWYDEGIRYGREWEEEILEKLSGCYVFIFIVTENSLNSENCADEIYRARESHKNFINVVFDSNIVINDKFMFRYGRYQMCNIDKFPSFVAAIDDLSAKCEWFNSVVVGNPGDKVEKTNVTDHMPRPQQYSGKKDYSKYYASNSNSKSAMKLVIRVMLILALLIYITLLIVGFMLNANGDTVNGMKVLIYGIYSVSASIIALISMIKGPKAFTVIAGILYLGCFFVTSIMMFMIKKEELESK